MKDPQRSSEVLTSSGAEFPRKKNELVEENIGAHQRCEEGVPEHPFIEINSSTIAGGWKMDYCIAQTRLRSWAKHESP
jgi:hypothetical protein